jgi:nucleotide-binding universal stress UspA family protein
MQNDESATPLKNSDEEPTVLLVALDGSTGARRVLAMAARLARSLPGATLHVVHVFRTGRFDRAPAGGHAQNSDALADAKDTLAAYVRAARLQCRNDVVGHFVVGDPTGEILRICGEVRAQVLVTGTHDHVGFERWLLGSVAETLVRKAPCSVMVVRPAKH